MRLQTVSETVLTLLLIGMLTLAFDIQPVKPSGDTVVYVDPSTSTVVIGETFTLNIIVSNVENLNAYQIGLTFDPDILEATSFVAGDFFLQAPEEYRTGPVNQPWGENNIAPGICHAIAWALKKPGNVSGTGTLATVTFEAKAIGSSTVNITRTGVEEAKLGCLIDPETIEWITFNITDGTVTAPPIVGILSPQNTTYTTSSVPLTFTVNVPTSWIGYSLDGQANVTINGNTTLTDLSEETHRITVYANDTSGNMGSSDQVYFTMRAPVMSITVNTDKQIYCVMNSINIYGDLTLGNQPISDGLVALEVKDPSDHTIVIRTLQTGTTPPDHTITITKLIPCDEYYRPTYEFLIGSCAYFFVFVNNTSPEPQFVLVTLNVYDGSGVPIGMTYLPWTQGPGEIAWFTSFWIPDWIATGTAKAYAGVYTDWPSSGGTPQCPEKSESFTIYELGGGGSSTEAQALGTSQSIDGTYNLSFTSSTKAKTGIYTVYVTSSYEGKQATNSTTFLVNVPDINGDGYVNVLDLGLLSDAWLTESGEPDYNPNADFNWDGLINILDLAILSDCWLWSQP